MMKTVKYTLCLLLVSLLLFSCRKYKKTPLVEPKILGCPEMYDARSTPYINPYMGPIIPSILPVGPGFPEPYSYEYLCVNPNNKYEIAYCRVSNDTPENNLYTYNFCTGQTTLLIKDIGLYPGYPDWSVKDWIIFRGSEGLSKIKSNGDSLTTLPSAGGFYAKWSKDGTKYLWNRTKISDEQGVLLYDIPRYAYMWKNNTEVIGGDINGLNFEIFVLDLNTKTVTKSINIPASGKAQINTLHNDDLYFHVSTPNRNKKQYTIDINTFDTTFKYQMPESFVQNISGTLNNKFLVQQVLMDTLYQSPFVNIRHHVAIMNIDGSNIRRVLIPE